MIDPVMCSVTSYTDINELESVRSYCFGSRKIYLMNLDFESSLIVPDFSSDVVNNVFTEKLSKISMNNNNKIIHYDFKDDEICIKLRNILTKQCERVYNLEKINVIRPNSIRSKNFI